MISWKSVYNACTIQHTLYNNNYYLIHFCKNSVQMFYFKKFHMNFMCEVHKYQFHFKLLSESCKLPDFKMYNLASCPAKYSRLVDKLEKS